MQAQKLTFWIATSLSLLAMTSGVAGAAINIPFTINLSENVTVTGTPRIAVDVGGNTRYATYTSGTGTNALTFTLSPNIGDVDLDGVTVSSPIDLNGGTIKDTSGNDATLTFTPPNTSGIKINYPSLGMDFTSGTSGRYTLNGTVYNDFSSFLTAAGGTFSRNSVATYYDSTGTLQTAPVNTPRFDYDPVTHAAKGILIEEERTNLIRNSYMEDWTGAYPNHWNNPGNNIVKVPGVFGTNAMRITGPFTNNGNRISVSFHGTILPSTPYTMTIRVKLISGNGTLNLAIDSWSSSAFSFSASNMVSGQYVTLTQTSTSTAGVINSGGLHTNSTNIVAELDYIQLEQGSFATSYIPTMATAITRKPDSLSMPVGSWYNQPQGTLLAKAFNGVNGSTVGLAALEKSGAAGTDRLTLIRTSTVNIEAMSSVGGAAQFQTALSGNGHNSLNSTAFAYQAHNFRQSLNGASSSLGTSGTVPTVDTLRLGAWAGGTQYYDGWLQTIKYYPLRVGDTQLQLMTQ